jgi:hypothetical protein
MIWYRAVEHGLGLTSAYGVNQLLEPGTLRPGKDGIIRSRKWEGYRDGKHVPKDSDDSPSMVSLAERFSPGTAHWFRSPLWKALRGEFSHHQEVENCILEIEHLHPILYQTEKIVGFTAHSFKPEGINKCVELDGIFLLESVVMAMEYSHLTRHPELIAKSRELYIDVSLRISEIAPVSFHYLEMLDTLDYRYLPSPAAPWTEDSIPPWYVRLPEKVIVPEH